MTYGENLIRSKHVAHGTQMENQPSFCRLDYFLISENLRHIINRAKIKPGCKTDHSLIQITIDNKKQDKGPGYFKLNNTILLKEEYQTRDGNGYSVNRFLRRLTGYKINIRLLLQKTQFLVEPGTYTVTYLCCIGPWLNAISAQTVSFVLLDYTVLAYPLILSQIIGNICIPEKTTFWKNPLICSYK